MQAPDPLSAHPIGGFLSTVGLAVLMLSDAGEPQPLATAAGCLVAALAAFAVDAVRRPSRRPRRRSAGRRRATDPGRRPAPVPEAAASSAAVTAGRWSMPASQRDPRVHAALCMSVERFLTAGPPGTDDIPEPPRAGGRGPAPIDARATAQAAAQAAMQDSARRAALADVRSRRLARQN